MMCDLSSASLALAMAAPAAQGTQPSLWVQLMPFVLVLAIFYFVILLPMKRRQKKVQQFLDGLKVGDRVITSGGLYGVVTRLGDKSVQIQIADKIKVDISRASVAGYQGQEPIVTDNNPQ